jgi:site-specific DNA-methyltransferase (adenine-specific)
MTASRSEPPGVAAPEPWQLLPDLDPEEYEALKADIAAHGVLVPVEVDERGDLLDGHHRVRAWSELRAEGVKLADYPRVVRGGLSDAEKRQIVRALNLARRHLNADQRRALIADAIRDDPTASDRRVALALGVTHPTVAAVRSELEEAGDVERLSTRVDSLGRTQPARRPSVIARSARDERRAVDALATMGDQAPTRLLDLRTAEREARQVGYQRMRDATEPASTVDGERFELRAGDFATVLDDLDPGSVDLVLTDPPYTDEFGARWVELSELCARVLRPGGVAVFYSGHHNLPEVISQLGEHLVWLWHVVVVQPGQESRFMATHVHNGHRDLLAYCAGTYQPRRWLRDTITVTTAADKSLHPWQQGLQTPAYLVDMLSDPGGLVLDPCCGSATFGVAALGSGRRFLGVDVDPVTVGVAADRLREVAAGAENGAAS